MAAVLLPAAVLVGWLIRQSYRNERHALERHLIGAARATSLLVDAHVAERQALLQGLATSGRLQRGEVGSFRTQAELVVPGPNEWIVLIDPEGQQLMNTLLPPNAPLPKISFREEFRDAARKGLTYVSNVTTGPASGHLVLFVAIPVFRDAELRYTLNFAMRPEVFGPVLHRGGAAKTWVVSLVDREGTIGSRTRNPAEFVGKKAGEAMRRIIAERETGVVESVTLDGIESITAFARSSTTDWTVIVASPAAELFASAQRLLLITLAVTLMLGGVAALLAWWAGRGVVVAVQSLVAGTEAVGHGRVLVGGETGIAETDTVFRALQESSAKLAARETDLLQANLALTTTAKALREKQDRLDAALTASGTGTLVWHPDTGTFESDEGLNALLGVGAERPLRTLEDFLALVHPEEVERVRAAMVRGGRGEGDISCELRVVRRDGATRWLTLRGRSSGRPGDDAVAAACVDVTERKAAEGEIARARDAALAAARAKDEFLAALSHELRTPLNPVLLVASDGAQRGDFSDAAREAFAMIAKNVSLEARLIDDLLDLTRITQGKLLLETSEVDVHGVLREAIETVRADLAQKEQSLELELEAKAAVVRGDPTRLQQVFWNLLKNAVKFTPVSGRVAVRTRTTSDDRVEIEVSDTGLGLTPDEIGRLFKTFSQGDHANGNSHRFGGLGLGLAISRMLVELHAGEIAARSDGRGQGAVFTVRLPVWTVAENAEARARPAAAKGSAAGGRGERILLVEDHDATRMAIGRLLERRGYRVDVATNAAEALRHAVGQRYDVVLSDIGLPDADGYTLMKRLRERYGLRGVALTGYGMEDDIERGRAAGFEAHLTKPVDVNKLAAVLARMLGGEGGELRVEG
jgi:PAS domain S-box